LLTSFSTSSRAQAQAPMTMTPAPVKPAPTSASPPAMTNAAPVLPPDTLGRYGKILAPSDEMSHPLKLKMPLPDVGEVKVPSADELALRDKLEQLSLLSDSEIREQLNQWPAFSKMNLRDEGMMLQRIQDFRDYRTRVAMQKAHDLGLLTLTPDQKVRFEKDYWDKRLQMDRDLARQFQPVLKTRVQKMGDELFREFSSMPPGPLAQVPAPAAKPPPTPPPAAQNKTNSSAASSPPQMSPLPPQPMGQAPH
jgi:hypothetical protein